MDDYQSFVGADIPGLGAGAHEGKGLGIRFLKHTERTHLLVHLLDFSVDSDRDPIADYQIIQNELKHFSEDLFNKPQILVAAKIDHPEAEAKLKKYQAQIEEIDPHFMTISSVTRQNLKELVYRIYENLNQEKEKQKEE